MYLTLINKILSMYVLLRHGRLPREYKYYYRHSYYCRLVQLKYTLRDHLFRKKYKEIAFGGEFAPDIMYALPFAYWHFKNGTLRKTIGAKYTRHLYFFSSDHDEAFDNRYPKANFNFEIPHVVYSHDYDYSKWIAPPLKETYKNDIYVYDKPILIIANRYNSEWDGPPISFFDIPTLDFMFSQLQSKYTIIYNRPRPQHITMDNSDIHDLNEFDWLKKTYPGVILLEDLYKENKAEAKNYNHMQLMVYANANHFISIHGGTASLASYFGGINLIYSKKGPEHYFGCFHKLFPRLSGAKILHAKEEAELKNFIREYFA